jgi:membrane-bound lytic murein transglycosylase D
MRMSWNRFLRAGCVWLSLPLALVLTGCPARRAAAPASAAPQATAPALAAPKPAPQPSSAAAPRPNAAEQQRVRQVIAQAEAAYAQGEADYRKGQLAEAKTQFDRAVDLMLSCGIDIRSNPQLGDAFDKIVDQVNALEMEALKQGNGFVSREEITPAEAASDVTFAVDPNLVARARADLATTKSDLPLMVNEYVASFINFFAYTQKGHNTLLHSFERAGLYKGMIQRILAEEGVPQDLIYLAVAESGFQPRAIDRKSKAGGMWQFMPYGNYGLTRNEYVDERFDPEKSTRAYARYMKFLYDQLGDWYLAMAAYDWGAGNVQRAVEKTGYADFWELYKRHNLPSETQNYVPEILAAIIIANNPHQYGFDDVALDPPVLTDTVTVNYSVDLRLVSDLVGAPVDEIEALNPSLLRGVTPPDEPFDLHLPAGTSTLFDQRIAMIPEDKRNSWRYHTVVTGDTLDSVAREYRVPVSDLAAANRLNPESSADESLAGLQALVVPVRPEAAPSAHARLYRVRPGDTLVTIADRFGVSIAQLRRWNGIPSGTRVEPGRRLHIAEPASRIRTAVSRRRSPGKRSVASAAGRSSDRSSSASRSRSPAQTDPKTSRRKSGSRTGSKGEKGSALHAGTAAQ